MGCMRCRLMCDMHVADGRSGVSEEHDVVNAHAKVLLACRFSLDEVLC